MNYLENYNLLTIPLWWQLKGLSFTRSGYGAKIPTAYKLYHNGRLKRVYAIVFSNAGSTYIMHKKERIFLR